MIFRLYSEHNWSLNEIISHFPDSNINQDKVEISTGISHAKANEFLKV